MLSFVAGFVIGGLLGFIVGVLFNYVIQMYSIKDHVGARDD